MKNSLLVIVLLSFIACQPGEDPTTDNMENKVEKEQIADDSFINVYDDINKRIKQNVNNANLYIERGRIAAGVNNPELAIADFERAKSIDSLNANVWVYRSQLDVLAGQLNEAKMHLERALSLDEMNKDALCEMARVQYQLRDMKLAYKFVNDAIRADEQYFLPYYVKGMILLAAGDTVKAVSSLQTSVELNPDYYDGFIQIGELYDGERNALALDYYNSAISIQAKNPLAYYYKAMFLQNAEQLEEAYVTYDQILAIDSTYKFAYYNQGYICLEYLEEYEIGIERFTKAIELDKNYYSAFYNRGLCYENIGQKTKAEADYKLALSIKPNYDLAALGLSRLLEK